MPSVYAAPPEFVHAPLRLSETALRTQSALTVYPTDRGTLAALNAYGHDYPLFRMDAESHPVGVEVNSQGSHEATPGR